LPLEGVSLLHHRLEFLAHRLDGCGLDLLDFAGIHQLLVVEVLDRRKRFCSGCGVGDAGVPERLQRGLGRLFGFPVGLGLAVEPRDGRYGRVAVKRGLLAVRVYEHRQQLAVDFLGDDGSLSVFLERHGSGFLADIHQR